MPLHTLRVIAFLLMISATMAAAGLEITALGKNYTPDPQRVVIQQTRHDTSGSTSVRNEEEGSNDWKRQGYYQRNRDLGQVFVPESDFQLDAVVLRTGPSDIAVLEGAPGAKMFIQFFEVAGSPRINDNGTPPGTEARQGFTKNHRGDDFLEGVGYKSLRIVKGGVFPQVPVTRTANMETNDAGKMVYLRWDLTGSDEMKFESGKRYAFVIGFETPGKQRGFTLANINRAGVDAPLTLTTEFDFYHPGWGLRREGNGLLPPTMLPGDEPIKDRKLKNQFIRESLLPIGRKRFRLAPSTDGYPDVDTYRDLEFYLEGR
ncbi:MAG: hypothetical protein H0X66_22250 [Verrucomicrobia bacterium]|nr:hypothetical protein [Verrucomicrobiota bacterium]